MRRREAISTRIYNILFPQPTGNDPQSFSAHLQRSLVPEVRIETTTFYGSLDTIEARYPGLDYCHPPHRMRLGRFPHHKRLFQIIDELNLTQHEVRDFCRWEGTRWARERYEADERIKVLDTTGHDIPRWVDTRAQRKKKQPQSSPVRQQEPNLEHVGTIEVLTEIEVVEELSCDDELVDNDWGADAPVEDEEMSDADEQDGEQGPMEESLTPSFTNRFRAAVEARSRGEQVDLDPIIEQYLKEQSEGSELDDLVGSLQTGRAMPNHYRPSTTVSAVSATPTIRQPAA
ncbi:hypothetical protein LTR66_000357 [Elasticomyces elasticus]|nr:hypothetical protein LTR66_000357 [Elasticomyces elasticus]